MIVNGTVVAVSVLYVSKRFRKVYDSIQMKDSPASIFSAIEALGDDDSIDSLLHYRPVCLSVYRLVSPSFSLSVSAKTRRFFSDA